MTLAQLRYLLAIVDANLNITTAADRMNATQPGLSKQIKSLEDELGFQIFVRRGKSLDRLSPAGAKIVERARVILSEAASIRALAANERGESGGELIIGTTQTQARCILPSALKRLKVDYPAVNVRLNFFTEADRVLSAPQTADILIASASDWPETSDLVVPLYQWRRIALVPKDHPLAEREGPLRLADLAPFPLIGYESALGSHASVADAFSEAGAPAEFAYATHDTEVIKTYVRTGLGVGLLAEMASDDQDLVRLPVEGLPSCNAYALLRRDRVVRDYVVDFLANLAPHVSRREIVRGLRPAAPPPVRSAPDWAEWRHRVLGVETPAASTAAAAA